MSVRAVVLDIGGVLELTPPLAEVMAPWEARLGFSLEERLGDVWRAGAVGAITLTEYELAAAEVLGDDARAFHADMWQAYLGELNVELATYFRALRPRYQTAIISNSFVGAREKEAEAHGFGDICDHIVYSHEVGVSKPDRRIFELACQRLRIEPHEMVFVDDVPAFVEAASALGIKAIQHRDNAATIAAIEACLRGDPLP